MHNSMLRGIGDNYGPRCWIQGTVSTVWVGLKLSHEEIKWGICSPISRGTRLLATATSVDLKGLCRSKIE